MAEVNNTSSKYDANLMAVLDAIVADLTELRAHMVLNVADIAELRTHMVLNVADVSALDTALDTLAGKLNSDAGVTDEDYAGAVAMTGSDPAALTGSAPAALTTSSD